MLRRVADRAAAERPKGPEEPVAGRARGTGAAAPALPSNPFVVAAACDTGRKHVCLASGLTHAMPLASSQPPPTILAFRTQRSIRAPARRLSLCSLRCRSSGRNHLQRTWLYMAVKLYPVPRYVCQCQPILPASADDSDRDALQNGARADLPHG